jgi:hypothetical protein
MALDFPAAPTEGQLYDSEGIVWRWSATTASWSVFSSAGVSELAILNIVHPVGSIHITTLADNPATYWQNTVWELDSVDMAMVGAGGNRTGSEEFGSDTHTLEVAEMPLHTHNVNPPNTTSTSAGAHTHSIDPPNTNTGNESQSHTHWVDSSASQTGTVSAWHKHYSASGALLSGNTSIGAVDGVLAGPLWYPVGGGYTANPDANHTHSANPSGVTSGGRSVSHTHALNIAAFTSGAASTNHTHNVNIAAFNSASMGSDEAHSSVQASKAFYIWKRTS